MKWIRGRLAWVWAGLALAFVGAFDFFVHYTRGHGLVTGSHLDGDTRWWAMREAVYLVFPLGAWLAGYQVQRKLIADDEAREVMDAMRRKKEIER
jgi:hypothetical protein